MPSQPTKFLWPNEIPVPRNSRRIGFPVQDSPVRVVSDLIPTQVITETFPAIGEKYGSIFYTNQTKDRRFANHEFNHAQEEPGDYTRLYFNPSSDSLNPAVPFKTFYTKDSSICWPPICEGVDFYADDATVVAGVPGHLVGKETSLWTVVKKMRPAYKGLTTVRIDQYLSAEPFDLSSDTDIGFTPTNIFWNLAGTNGRGETGECLHNPLTVPGVDMTTVAQYVWNEDNPNGTTTSSSDRTSRAFQPTGGIESFTFAGSIPGLIWLDQIVAKSVTPKGGLYLMEIATAIRPEPENAIEEYLS